MSFPRKQEEEQRRAGLGLPLAPQEPPPPPVTVIPTSSGDKASDSFTTNVYVGNLNPTVDETTLCRDFGRFGPLASVKVIWARTPEEKARGRQSGFVAYMRRDDAERALKAMQGIVYYGFEIRLSWGKPMPLPPVPYFVSPNPLPSDSDAPSSSVSNALVIPTPYAIVDTGLPFNAQPRKVFAAIAPPGTQQAQHDPVVFNAVVHVRMNRRERKKAERVGWNHDDIFPSKQTASLKVVG